MNKNYEIMTIVDLDLGDAKAKELSKQVQGFVTSLGGDVAKDDFWGKRKFAYEIKRKTEGFYDVLTFGLDTAKMADLKEKLSLTPGLVRYLITVSPENKEE